MTPPRWRSDLIKETDVCNDELLQEIEDAVNDARARHRAEFGHLEEEEEDPSSADVPEKAEAPPVPTPDDPNDTRPLAQRRSRRHRVALVQEAVFDLRDACNIVSTLALEKLKSFRSVCCDYVLPQ